MNYYVSGTSLVDLVLKVSKCVDYSFCKDIFWHSHNTLGQEVETLIIYFFALEIEFFENVSNCIRVFIEEGLTGGFGWFSSR
jgi:hypothetical protein